MTSAPHSFRDSLAWERQQQPLLSALWSSWWRGSERCAISSVHLQKSGVDAVLVGYRGGRLTSALVEEKVRAKDYGDVLLEVVSNDRTGAEGWATSATQRSNLLLYAVSPSRSGIVLPTRSLQAAARRNLGAWRSAYGEHASQNEGYRSINVPVPTRTLLSAIDLEYGRKPCVGCSAPVRWSDRRGATQCSECSPDLGFRVVAQ